MPSLGSRSTAFLTNDWIAQAKTRKQKREIPQKKVIKSADNIIKKEKSVSDKPNVTVAKLRTEKSHWFARAFFSYGLPVSSIKDYINSPLGGRAEFGYQFGKRWAYQPFAFADFDAAKGKTPESAKSIDNYQSYAFGAGLAAGLTLTKDWGLSPYLAAGYNIGQFKRTADTVDFRLPLAEAGLSFAYRFTARISAVYQLSYRHVFDPDIPGGYVVNRLGVSAQW